MKKIDSDVISLYIRIAFFFLSASLLIGVAYLFGHGSFKLLLILVPVSLVAPLPIMLFLDKTSSLLTSIYSGGRSGATLADQLAGELNKCRYLKSEKRFAQALQTADFILEQMPEHAEALLLKAQLLHEGFADLRGAKECLRKIIHLDPPPESTTRQWAKGMLEEVNQHLKQEKEQESS